MFIVKFLCMFLLVCLACSSPPEDPVQCSSRNKNCIVTNSYGTFPDRAICRAAEVIYPKTETELIHAVARASREKKKVKVVTRYSHSMPKLVCPDGKKGLLISTRFLNKILEVNKFSRIITVESGVTLREVIDHAAKAGLALPYTPYWWGLTMGGLLGTGAHGSTLWGNGSAVHEYVVGLKIVTPAGANKGCAKVISLDNSHPDMNAAKVSLGVLGVISQITLKLQPMFKRSMTLSARGDSDLGDQVVSFGRKHEFADITWYPSQRTALYRLDDRVSSNVSGNGVNEWLPLRSTLSEVLAIRRASEEGLELADNAAGKCVVAQLTVYTLMAAGFGYSSNGIRFNGYPIVGFQNRLQASGSCLDSPNDLLSTVCPWDSRVKAEYYHQTAFSIGLSKVKNFIQDVQKLRDLEPNAFCGIDLYNGILMRYVKASSAYMGKEEDGVDFDITYYRSKDAMTPRLYEDILEEVEQIAMFKYGGSPHWGKNRNVAFEGVIKKYSKAGEFLKVRERYDPTGLFSNAWTNQILGVKGHVNITRNGCALEGLCICSLDSHCAPSKGYVCRPGRVYHASRVCTKLN